jgi:hypothetical protein
MIDLSVPRAGQAVLPAPAWPGSLRRACSVRRAFKLVGIEFIDENGGGPGVRLRKRHWLTKPK